LLVMPARLAPLPLQALPGSTLITTEESLTLLLCLVGGVERGEVVGVSTLPQLLLAGRVGEMGGRGEEEGEGEGEGDEDILLNSSSC